MATNPRKSDVYVLVSESFHASRVGTRYIIIVVFKPAIQSKGPPENQRGNNRRGSKTSTLKYLRQGGLCRTRERPTVIVHTSVLGV